uniref:Ig-like domain-containing protein n=1 Tax=Amphilophus citrinellus TaxID=61819 RepID=A0A3Q0SNQ9_AMPCI
MCWRHLLPAKGEHDPETLLSFLSQIPIKPTVILQPSWTQIYRGETVTVRCEIQGGGETQWKYEWRPAKLNKAPTSSENRTIKVTESDSGGYRCRGKGGKSWTEWSEIITLTVSCKLEIFPPFYFQSDNKKPEKQLFIHSEESETYQSNFSAVQL